MSLTYCNNKWQYHPTTKIDTLNYNNLFPIIKLYNFNFSTSIVKIGNHFGNLIEHVQSLMHHSPLRLPLIAMAAAFPAFSAAYSIFPTRLLQHTRWLTAI